MRTAGISFSGGISLDRSTRWISGRASRQDLHRRVQLPHRNPATFGRSRIHGLLDWHE